MENKNKALVPTLYVCFCDATREYICFNLIVSGLDPKEFGSGYKRFFEWPTCDVREFEGWDSKGYTEVGLDWDA